MAGQTSASPRQRLVIGAIFVIGGLLICLIAAGVFKPDPRSIHAPLWLIGLIGLAFALAGGTVMLGASVPDAQADGSLPATAPLSLRVTQYLMGLTIVAALAVTGTWVSFGPGERHFTSTVTAFGASSSGAGGETFGRVIFGAGAILTWLFFILVAVQGARKLRWSDRV